MARVMQLFEARVVGEGDWIAAAEICQMCRIEQSALLELTELGVVAGRHTYAGWQVAASALREKVVEKVIFFYAPLLLGGEGRAMIGPLNVDRVALGYTLRALEVERSGNDVMVSAYVDKPGRNHVDRNLTN